MIPAATSGDVDLVRMRVREGFWVWLRRARSVPQGLKPERFFSRVAARVNSCPDTY